jgi:hypothetical protein
MAVRKTISIRELHEYLKERGWDLSEEKLTELTKLGYLPHQRMDEQVRIIRSEAVDWINDNLIQDVEGAPYPTALPVLVDVSRKRVLQAASLPLSLQKLSGVLRRVPRYDNVGVYFLCRGNTVVYVGQSVSVASRIQTHTDKDFDTAYYLSVPEEDLNKVEASFIEILQPEYNRNKKGTYCKPAVVSKDDAEAIVSELFRCLGLVGASADRSGIIPYKNKAS